MQAQIGTQGIDADDLEALQQILASHMTSPRGPFPAGLALNDIIAQASWKVRSQGHACLELAPDNIHVDCARQYLVAACGLLPRG